MLVYHLDRSNSCRSGQTFERQFLTNVEEEAPHLSKLCPDGLSAHGLRYFSSQAITFPLLDNSCRFINAKEFFMEKSFIDMKIIEYEFELVRRNFFPQRPSRLTSIFAIKSIEEFFRWPELLMEHDLSKCNIFEIEVPNETQFFDSNYLHGGVSFGEQSGQYFYFGFSPPISFEFAYRYWEGSPSIDPRWECIIPLPVTLGKKINL